MMPATRPGSDLRQDGVPEDPRAVGAEVRRRLGDRPVELLDGGVERQHEKRQVRAEHPDVDGEGTRIERPPGRDQAERRRDPRERRCPAASRICQAYVRISRFVQNGMTTSVSAIVLEPLRDGPAMKNASGNAATMHATSSPPRAGGSAG